MKHRKLRIAWSVAWGTAAVVLVALWVRDYRSSRHAWARFAAERKRESRLQVHLPMSETHQGSRMIYIRAKTAFDFGLYHFPYWALVATCCVFSAAPRVSLRYSLRTLLIATTLVAVGLRLIVWLR